MDSNGHWGNYGGQYCSQVLTPILAEIEGVAHLVLSDPKIATPTREVLTNLLARPTALTRLRHDGLAQIYLKREDQCPGGTYAANHIAGYVMVAKIMGITHILSDTMTGRHGRSLAVICRKLGLTCTIFMTCENAQAHADNVHMMERNGAHVVRVTGGVNPTTSAMNRALQQWVGDYRNSLYIPSTLGGPHPMPTLTASFQRVIGKEVKRQTLRRCGGTPDMVIASMGSGIGAAGIFSEFIDHEGVALVGVGPHGREHKKPGIIHGTRTHVLCDSSGQVGYVPGQCTGMAYPAVGPQHAYWADTGKVTYTSVDDSEASRAVRYLAKESGIQTSVESGYGLAYALKQATVMPPTSTIVVCLSGAVGKVPDGSV